MNMITFNSGTIKAFGYNKNYFFISTNGLKNTFDNKHTFSDRLKSAVLANDAPKINKLIENIEHNERNCT